MWLDGLHRKYIEEVGTSNVFFKINNQIITPELTGSILPGITRDSAIHLLRHWGYDVIERGITVEELYAAYQDESLEEAFTTGTATCVSPIGEFLWGEKAFKVADGGIGKVSQRLYDTLTGIQYGRLKDEFGWMKEV
jgi:branched-chain amino acid aminotransferase